jgi:hypothetical protein
MSAKFVFKALAGAVALAIGGTALANTSTDATTTGDLFLNIVDTTTNTAFFFDTGISQASFNGGSSLATPFNLASDPNYTAFKAAVGASDVLDYSVASATKTTATPNVGTVFFTTNNTPVSQQGSHVASAQATLASGFLPFVNGTTSTTTNSAYVTGGSTTPGSGNAAWWGAPLTEGVFQTQLGIASDNAAIGTALAFYSESSNALRSTSNAATTLSTFAGTWDLTSAGVLSYTVSSVPLPMPLVLLVSGLGLMGLMSRRGKSSSNDMLGNASAA